ncbi:hypothetical protein Tco_1532127 [Tanacetum coccineum]
MGNEKLNTIPKKESNEVIKSSVEDLVPIPSESEDTFESDSECDLPFCDNSMTFSNPLFNDNDDFTSSDDESLPEKDVLKENFKIYSNPPFEFDDEYISSDVNPLFNEALEDIESEDSYVSKLDEPDLLVTPLSKLNEDECFDPGGYFILEDIKACLTSSSIPPRIDDDDFDPEGDILLLEKLLNNDPSSPLPPKELNFEELKVIKSNVSTDVENGYHDSEGDLIYLESLLIKDTILNLPPEVFLDRDPRSLEDELDKDDLKYIVKDFPDYEDSHCFVLPIWPSYSSTITPDLKTDEKRMSRERKNSHYGMNIERLKRLEKELRGSLKLPRKSLSTLVIKERAARTSSTNLFSTVSTPAKASNGYIKNGQQQSQKGQNQARDWKTVKKQSRGRHVGDPEVSHWLKGRVSDLRVQKGWIGVGYQLKVDIGSSRTLLMV